MCESETDGQCEGSMRKFVIYGKNVQSIQTDERLHEMFTKVELMQHWDVILLNETCREIKEEQFITDAGHLFVGSGGTNGQKGVGVIFHSR